MWVESGGIKKTCATPDPRFGKEWPVIAVDEVLVNPYGAIKAKRCSDALPAITKWLKTRDPETFKLVVESCVLVAKKGVPVRITCLGGKHRSPAIAKAVGKRLGVRVVHRDRGGK